MPWGLERHYGSKDLHFITSSCYHLLPLLATTARRDLFLEVLEQVRRRYAFVVLGYVVMPEHFHLLVSEPQEKTLSDVMRALKLSFARRVIGRRKRSSSQGELFEPAQERMWQHRFYDFNVCTEKKRMEKLRYLHRNPVKRGLVASPELWKWSSFRSYAFGEAGIVKINRWDVLKLKRIAPVQFGDRVDPSIAETVGKRRKNRGREQRPPTSRKPREVGHPLNSFDVIETLADAMLLHGIPEHIRSDNGSEFIATKLRKWLSDIGAKTLYIEPGSPWENGYCESFNGKLRDEYLNGEIFYSLKEARIVIEQWRVHYNTRRPHSSLGYRPPAPAAILPTEQKGHADVENAARFPHPHTPDGGYGQTTKEALH